MFSAPNHFKPAGIFSVGHLILLALSLTVIYFALWKHKSISKQKLKSIIRLLTLFVLALEIAKIIFTISVEGVAAVNSYVPLYFCSITLFASLASGFGHGKLEHIANIFLAIGGTVGGLIFLISPVSSLTKYPIFHFIALHSFIYHSIMFYIGIQIIRTKYITLKLSDFKSYASVIIIFSGIAFIFNAFMNSNLMFISRNFPGTPVEWLYTRTGSLFTPAMIIIQAVVPFFVVYGILKILPILVKNSQPQLAKEN